MSLTIDQLLSEADDEIKGTVKKAEQAPQHQDMDAEPVKLAHFLEDFAEQEPQQEAPVQQKTASPEPAQPEMEDTTIAKVAHAAAILETAERIEEFKKSAAFIKKAREAGHSEEAIAEFLLKNASKGKAALKALAVGGGIAGAGYAGHEVGEEKGKKKGRMTGYVEGARDYRDALRRRIMMAHGKQQG